jgi:hypothetical protein
MTTSTLDKDTPILVEFAPQPGMRAINRMSAAELAKKSAEAVEAAMGTIKAMAQRVGALRDDMPHEFTRVEIDFGVKLDAEAGALLARAGGEASLNVTLTWERPDEAERGK